MEKQFELKLRWDNFSYEIKYYVLKQTGQC